MYQSGTAACCADWGKSSSLSLEATQIQSGRKKQRAGWEAAQTLSDDSPSREQGKEQADAGDRRAAGKVAMSVSLKARGTLQQAAESMCISRALALRNCCPALLPSFLSCFFRILRSPIALTLAYSRHQCACSASRCACMPGGNDCSGASAAQWATPAAAAWASLTHKCNEHSRPQGALQRQRQGPQLMIVARKRASTSAPNTIDLT